MKKKDNKLDKYYPKLWYLFTILITNIAFSSFAGLEVYKIVNAYSLDNSLDTRQQIISCALLLMIGVAVVFPANIINYAVEYFKKKKIQLVLLFVELFVMMLFMIKLLFAII